MAPEVISMQDGGATLAAEVISMQVLLGPEVMSTSCVDVRITLLR